MSMSGFGHAVVRAGSVAIYSQTQEYMFELYTLLAEAVGATKWQLGR